MPRARDLRHSAWSRIAATGGSRDAPRRCADGRGRSPPPAAAFAARDQRPRRYRPGTEVAAAQVAPLPDRTTDEGDGGDDAVAVDRAGAGSALPAMVPTGWKIQIAAAPN